jgi:hypothetical protein
MPMACCCAIYPAWWRASACAPTHRLAKDMTMVRKLAEAAKLPTPMLNQACSNISG